MTLPFGESHWDYLPDLVQNYIVDLESRAVHRERMKAVCKSIHQYGQWCYQPQSILEMFFDDYPEIYRLNTSVLKSQVCPECFKLFSPEIVLSKHLSICNEGCLDPSFKSLEEEMDYYSSLFEDGVDDVYDDEDIDF